MLENGYELVTMSITGTAKAILVLKKVLYKVQLVSYKIIEIYLWSWNYIIYLWVFARDLKQ